MFKININDHEGMEVINIANAQFGIELDIIASFGAIINRFVVSNSPFSFIAGYRDHQDLLDTHPFFSRSAKLFPFPNRLASGRYQFAGQSYQLAANFPWSEHAVHGLLYNQPFHIKVTDANVEQASVTLSFVSSQLDNPGYPFPFTLEVEFVINTSGKLTCRTSITNTGASDLPFGDAWHPYFSLGVERSELLLNMSPCHEWLHEQDLPTGEKRPFDQFTQAISIEGHELNHCFEFDSSSDAKLTLSRTDDKACLHFAQDAHYPFIQLYTPASESSIAVEPMTCPANVFNNGFGLLVLKPGKTQTLEWHCQAIYHG